MDTAAFRDADPGDADLTRWLNYLPALEYLGGAVRRELAASAPGPRLRGEAALVRLEEAWRRGHLEAQALAELRVLAAGDTLPGSLIVRAVLDSVDAWLEELEGD